MERERAAMKEKEGPCHLLCAERERQNRPLAKKSGGDEDAGREVEGEKGRQKTRGGGGDLVPVWQAFFFCTSSVGSPLHRNPFDPEQYVADRVCADRQTDRLLV